VLKQNFNKLLTILPRHCVKNYFYILNTKNNFHPPKHAIHAHTHIIKLTNHLQNKGEAL